MLTGANFLNAHWRQFRIPLNVADITISTLAIVTDVTDTTIAASAIVWTSRGLRRPKPGTPRHLHGPHGHQSRLSSTPSVKVRLVVSEIRTLIYRVLSGAVTAFNFGFELLTNARVGGDA